MSYERREVSGDEAEQEQSAVAIGDDDDIFARRYVLDVTRRLYPARFHEFGRVVRVEDAQTAFKSTFTRQCRIAGINGIDDE